MWRWQPSGRNRLWHHVIASCALVHLGLLCLLFLVYRGSVDNYLIYTSSALTTQHVVLVPLQKVVGGAKAPSVSQAASAPIAQSISTQSEVIERKTPVQESKATTLASAKKTHPPAPRLRRAEKNKSKKKTKKKRDKKSKKNVREKKSKKQLKEKSQKPEKIEIEKKVEEQKPVEKPAKPSEAKHFLRSHFDSMSEGRADAQQAIYVGQLEYEALQLQEAMQQELQTHWKPPIGHTGLTCVVRIILDWQGAISDVIIEQTSGVLLFDMSAEQALHVMTFPKTAWGKQVTITFS